MLVTLDDMKDYLGLAASNITYDDFLEAQLTLISAAVEGYCGRVFGQDDYVQTFYRDEFVQDYIKELFLYHYPVNSITEILEDGTALTDYRLQGSSGRIVKTDDGIKIHWFQGIDELQITYNAGYASLPSEIDATIKSLVQERYNKHISGINVSFGNNVQRVSIPGVMSLDFDYTLSANSRKTKYGMILGDYVNILDPFRSERYSGQEIHIAYVEAT